MNKYTLILCCMLLSGMVHAQGFLKAEGTRIIRDDGSEIILRGFGLGGHMLQEGYMLRVPFSGQQYVFRDSLISLMGEEKTEKFYHAWRTNHTRRIDVDSLKSWGFNSIRLPMHYNLFTLSVEQEPVAGKNTWIETGFAMTDELLQWCKENQLYLILDMHATPGGQGHDLNISDRNPDKPSLWESEANKEKLLRLWQKLAERYKDEPWIGGYDLINEPNWAFDEYAGEKGVLRNGVADQNNQPLRDLQIRLTRAIREIDRNHLIIIEGNGWGNNYKGVLPPWDNNMVISFHKYWNYNDENSISDMLRIRETYQCPVWLGETGENSNHWFREAVSLVEKHNIGWCWWPLKKLGFNNPLEVKINPGYRALLQYWEGKAQRPSPEETYEAVMQLAENLKLEHCIYHKDVVDALIRQPHSPEALAWEPRLLDTDLIIPAVDYDLGPMGTAYYDKDAANYHVSTGEERSPWNHGRLYRNDGIDIYEDSLDGSFFAGDNEAGEWMQYTLNAPEDLSCEVSVLVRSGGPGEIGLEHNNEHRQAGITNTQNKWIPVTLGRINFDKGKNTFRIHIKKGGFDLKQIYLKPL